MLTALRSLRRSDLALGLAGALLLAVPDLARQLLVRDDPSRLHALLVDALGVASAAVLQIALIGLLAGRPPLRGGAALLVAALRRRPAELLRGLVGIGAVSGLITLPPSVALLGAAQVLGPLSDPPLRDLVLAQLSDVLATALTAPWFAVLARRLAEPPDA